MTVDYAALDAALLQEFPKYKLLYKRNSRLMRFINALLVVISFGQQRRFMSSFITTVGYTVYVHDGWSGLSLVDRMIVLRHERVHMRQRVRYGMWLFTFLYLLCPLPACFAYFRAKFEKEAYEETLRAMVDLYPDGLAQVGTEACREYVVGQFTGSSYLWMWPFRNRLDDWFTDVLVSIIAKRSL